MNIVATPLIGVKTLMISNHGIAKNYVILLRRLFVASLLLIGGMLIRPTHLGEDYAVFGSIIVFSAGTISFFWSKNNAIYAKNSFIIAGSVVVLWIFLSIHSGYNETAKLFAVFSLILICLSSLGAALAFSSPGTHHAFFMIFRIYLCVAASSAIVTLAVSLVVPIDALVILHFPSKTYSEAGDVYFPFTIGYNRNYYLSLVPFPRIGAGFREAGIAQAFYCFAIASMPRMKGGWARTQLILLIAGVIFTQSTTGFLLLGTTIFLRALREYGRNTRKLLAVIGIALPLTVASIVFAFNNDVVGIASKTGTESYSDREYAIEDGLKSFLKNPFGYGVYNSPGRNGEISLLASLGAIGIFGAVFVFLSYFLSFYCSFNKWEKFQCMLPLVATGFFSQPFLDAGLFYIMLMYLAETPSQRLARVTDEYGAQTLRRRRQYASSFRQGAEGSSSS